MRGERVKTKTIRRGLHEFVGVTHTRPNCPGGSVCGGAIRIEWCPGGWDSEVFDGERRPYFIPHSWESHCIKCGDCDSNGWPTLAECIENSPAFFDLAFAESAK